MLFLKVLSLLPFVFGIAISTDLKFSCSIVHNLPIPSDRKIYPTAQNILRREDEYEEVCIIASATINSTGSSVIFPVYRSIELFYPVIPFIGPNLFRQLDPSTVNLELRKGSLKELYYGLSRLETLRISETGLHTFEVLPVSHESLRTLVIHEPLITEVPSNIRYLVALQLLDLSGCALTTVQLPLFANLAELKVLNLAENQLASVGVGDDGFALPHLVLFDVRQNQLAHIDHFPEMFPALRFTRIMQNHWDCEWVSEVREKVWLRNITVLGNDFRCVGRMSNGGLCCSYRSPARARLAISGAVLTVLEELDGSPDRRGDDSIKESLKLRVYENETVDGVIGLEMEHVGVYLQEPINKV